MFAVRFPGRGGQGVMTAAELLAARRVQRGDRHAQAFPSFAPKPNAGRGIRARHSVIRR